LGSTDGIGSGNFWLGLNGSGSETDRLAISINGNQTTGVVSNVSISKTLYLSGLTADRALYLDGSKVVNTSSVTGTELGYLSGVTSGIQGQLNAKATFTYVDTQNSAQDIVIGTKASTVYVDTQLATRVAKSGDTMSGNLINSASFISPSFYNTGSSLTYNEVSHKNQWWRVAITGPTQDKIFAEFMLTYSVAGQHAFVHFRVGACFTQSPTITVINSSTYGTPLVQKIRLSMPTASIYDEGYVEMFLGNFDWYEDSVLIKVNPINQSPFYSDYSLYQTITAGTTSGYFYYEVACNSGFEVNQTGTVLKINNGIISAGGAFHCNGISTFTGDMRINSGQQSVSGSNFASQTLIRTDSGTDYGVGTSYSLKTGGTNYQAFYARTFGGSDGAVASSAQSQANGYFCIDVANAGLFKSDSDAKTSIFWANKNSVLLNGKVGIGTTSPEGDLHVKLAGAVNDYWGKLVVKATSLWGDGCSTRSETAGTRFATMFPMMFLNPHIVSDDDGWSYIRMGRSGGVATGRWWEIANRADGSFQIGVERSNQLVINPNGNVGIGTANPSYKLHTEGNIYASGSLLFGTNGTYTSGCIYSDFNYGCIFRGKQNAPAIAHFEWYASDNTNLMSISKHGVLNFYGGASAAAVPQGLSTTAGALVIGAVNKNYNDGWNTGLLMETSETTGISVHDSGEKLASFMYYSGGNRFLMGKDAGSGWGTTPIDIQGELYLNGSPKVGSSTSTEWTLRMDPNDERRAIWAPQKFVPIFDTLNVPDYVNWNGLSVFDVLYLPVACNILFQGFFTFFTNAVGQRYAYARLYHTQSNTYYYPEATKFFNLTSNHEVVPINHFFYHLPAGNYDLYMFGGGNVLVDGNDRAVFSAIVFT
jgi:hypothetical protein